MAERPVWAEIAALIIRTRDELCGEAEALAKWYGATISQSKPSLDRKDRTKYFFKTRRVNDSITLYWVETNFNKEKGNDKKPLHKHIQIKGKHRYGISSFPRAGEWERDLITEVENRAEIIREELALAAALSRTLSARTRQMRSEPNTKTSEAPGAGDHDG